MLVGARLQSAEPQTLRQVLVVLHGGLGVVRDSQKRLFGPEAFARVRFLHLVIEVAKCELFSVYQAR